MSSQRKLKAPPKVQAQRPADDSGIARTVTTKPQNRSLSNAARNTANLGLVRPPFVYLLSLTVGVLIQLVIPLPFLPRTLATPLGAALVVVAIALFWYSVAKFRAAGTPVPAREPTTTIVRTGP
jgi:protein-S-isoprenylcysteine O-methyltransferase Ste14